VIPDNGTVSKPSRNTVDQAVEKLTSLLREKSIALFAVIDHSGEAAKAGMHMRPTKLLIFGALKREHRSCWPLPPRLAICL